MAGPLPAEAVDTVVAPVRGQPVHGLGRAAGPGRGRRAASRTADGWEVDRERLADVQTSRRAALFLARRLELLRPATLRAAVGGRGAGQGVRPRPGRRAVPGRTPAEAAAGLDEAGRRRIVWVDEAGGPVLASSTTSCGRRCSPARRRRAPAAAPAGRRADRGRSTPTGSSSWPTTSTPPATGQRALPYALRAAELGPGPARARRRRRPTTGSPQRRPAPSRPRRDPGPGRRGPGRRADPRRAPTRRPRPSSSGPWPLADDRLPAGRPSRASSATSPSSAATSARPATTSSGPSASSAAACPAGTPGLVAGPAGRRSSSRSPTPCCPGCSWAAGRREGADREFLAIRLYSRLAYVYWFSAGKIPCAWAHLREMNLAERYPPTPELAQAYSEHAPVMTMVPWFGRGIAYARRSLAIRTRAGRPVGPGPVAELLRRRPLRRLPLPGVHREVPGGRPAARADRRPVGGQHRHLAHRLRPLPPGRAGRGRGRGRGRSTPPPAPSATTPPPASA